MEDQSQSQAQASLLPLQDNINTEPPCTLASSYASTDAPTGIRHVCSQLERDENQMVKTRRFKHRPLHSPKTQVRLLYVWTTSDGKFAGHLHHYELSSAPPYSALSYTWGSGSKQDILLDDRPIPVMSTLLAFLQALVEKLRTSRPFQRPDVYNNRWFWIDQLCIDQDSPMEKNHQIPQMGTIYQGAMQVIIWLGARSEDCEGFRTIRALFKSRIGLTDAIQTRQSHNYMNRPPDAEDGVSHHEYWERVWVVQEVKLAKQVSLWCGQEELSREEYMASLERNSERSDAYLSRFVMSDEVFDDITSACFFMMERLCRDPRDLIYGIQNLFKVENRFEVDYRKRKADLFLEVAIRALGECSLTEHPTLYMHVPGILWAFGVRMEVFRGCPKSHKGSPHLHKEFWLRQDCFIQVLLHPEILHHDELAIAISRWLPFKSWFVLEELGSLLCQPQHAQNRLAYIEDLVESLGRDFLWRDREADSIWRSAETYYPVRANGVHCQSFCNHCRSPVP